MFIKRLGRLLALAVILTGIGLAIFFYFKYKEATNKPSAEVAAEKLVEEVRKIADLPKDETPLIATVEDRTQIYDQAFFVKAQNGDKILVYNDAKVAYLYRPSTKQIINIGPVNFPSPTKAKAKNEPNPTGEIPTGEIEELSTTPIPSIILSPTPAGQ